MPSRSSRALEVWALWHLGMMISPVDGSFDVLGYATLAVELPPYSIIMAWFLERANRSLAVAIALHAGAHLDNVMHAPPDEIRLRILRTLVVAVAFAARSLHRARR